MWLLVNQSLEMVKDKSDGGCRCLVNEESRTDGGCFLKEKNFKRTIPPVKVEDHEEITYETASTALKRAVHFFSALQASDGHWPAENAGPLFFLPPLVSHDHPPSSTVTNFNSTKKCNC
ncbi:hypothetical protein LWI29_035855 [Acer saccharum]|uniref:Uncharacterized protein n=1 Tax=Acer saccharum TaxID=4024 RepID=A0AA39SPQ0_ACESA|nr:hypothetical protein LWI29_035855 [Acer saccharum]